MKSTSIGQNALFNVIKTISSMIFPIVTFPYSSQVLGPDGIGKVAFASSFVSYFILLASIGIPLYGNRAIGQLKGEKVEITNLSQELFVLNITSSLLSTLVLFGIVYLNGKLFEEKRLFLVLSSSIMLSSLAIEWLYQGLEQFKYITIRSIIISSISCFSIFQLVNGHDDYVLFAGIGVVASLGSSVFNLFNARNILFVKRTLEWDFKRHIYPLVKVFFMNFMISIYIQLDTVMLGFLSNSVDVGYYSAGLKITKILLAIVTSMGLVLIPRLSYYEANKMQNEFDEMIDKSFRLIWLLALPVVASLMVLSDELILIFTSKQFASSSIVLLISSPLVLFIGLSNILGLQILFPLGLEKKLILSVSLGALISFTLNLILIPLYSHIGAAFSALISELVVLLFMIILIPRNFLKYLFNKYILNYLFGSLLLSFFLILIKEYLVINLTIFIILIPIGFLFYVGFLVLIKDKLIFELSYNYLTKISFRKYFR